MADKYDKSEYNYSVKAASNQVRIQYFNSSDQIKCFKCFRSADDIVLEYEEQTKPNYLKTLFRQHIIWRHQGAKCAF